MIQARRISLVIEDPFLVSSFILQILAATCMALQGLEGSIRSQQMLAESGVSTTKRGVWIVIPGSANRVGAQVRSMIRLAVSGMEEALWRDVASRLRGATISTCLPLDQPLATTWEAVAFLGSGRPEPALIERWLNAGKHVLLAGDVPLPDDALANLFALAQRSNLRFLPINSDRYLPSRQLIWQQLDAGRLGEAVLVRLHRWEAEEAGAVVPRSELPGGLLRDLDLTMWLFGKPPDRVYAVEPSSGRLLQVHLGFAGGGMALIGWAHCLPPGDDYQFLSLIGSRGAAQVDDHLNVQLLFRGGHPQAVRTDEGVRRWAALLQDFVDALHSGGDSSGGQTNWKTVWAVAGAVRRSLETRQAVPLEES